MEQPPPADIPSVRPTRDPLGHETEPETTTEGPPEVNQERSYPLLHQDPASDETPTERYTQRCD